ncbi:MAG TPA: signal peptidase II [Candidatus Udaeobacter sp.]|nr:signal peptidase II [Candidatus Udaeobacter sp.]
MKNKKALLIILISGLFLLLDQFLKWQAFHNWTDSKLIFPYFGWQLFLNSGLAFGLPLSNSATIFLTLPMIGLIGYLFFKELNKKNAATPKLLLAWSILLAGATSNLLDRIFYHLVIDYFIIGTAIINIGDILIVSGLIIYLLDLKNKTQAAP